MQWLRATSSGLKSNCCNQAGSTRKGRASPGQCAHVCWGPPRLASFAVKPCSMRKISRSAPYCVCMDWALFLMQGRTMSTKGRCLAVSRIRISAMGVFLARCTGNQSFLFRCTSNEASTSLLTPDRATKWARLRSPQVLHFLTQWHLPSAEGSHSHFLSRSKMKCLTGFWHCSNVSTFSPLKVFSRGSTKVLLSDSRTS